MYVTGVPCNNPADGVNTSPVDTTVTYMYPNTYTYLCANGFEYNGYVISTCQADGTWSLTAPNCTGKNSLRMIGLEMLVANFICLHNIN